MKLYGVIGYPLGHSFSKKYFTQKFLTQGITDCAYESFPLKNIDELKDLLLKNKNICGLNVTIPHKQSVYHLLDDTTNLPANITACNCIKNVNHTLIGFNTDIIGFQKSLLLQLKNHHTHALVLGNGGAAVAVKYVLQKLNINYQIVSRKLHDGVNLTYEDVDENIVHKHLLIINTTPLGTFPDINECPNIPYQFLTPRHYLFDLVYNPAKSLFLQKGEEQGAAIENGYNMLVEQAEESWKIWNDI